MGFAKTMQISASALTAERLWMDVVSSNIANAYTTRPEGPYRRRMVVLRPNSTDSSFQAVLSHQVARGSQGNVVGSGVRVSRIVEDASPGERVYEPDHPDADEEGYVTYPNVNMVTEMVDLLAASRAFQANVTVINALKSTALKALSIGSR